MALLVFRLHKNYIGPFAGPYQVAVWNCFGQLVINFFDEMGMKVAPQPAGLDVRIHAQKRRFHQDCLRSNLAFGIPLTDGDAGESARCGWHGRRSHVPRR